MHEILCNVRLSSTLWCVLCAWHAFDWLLYHSTDTLFSFCAQYSQLTSKQNFTTAPITKNNNKNKKSRESSGKTFAVTSSYTLKTPTETISLCIGFFMCYILVYNVYLCWIVTRIRCLS